MDDHLNICYGCLKEPILTTNNDFNVEKLALMYYEVTSVQLKTITRHFLGKDCEENLKQAYEFRVQCIDSACRWDNSTTKNQPKCEVIDEKTEFFSQDLESINVMVKVEVHKSSDIPTKSKQRKRSLIKKGRKQNRVNNTPQIGLKNDETVCDMCNFKAISPRGLARHKNINDHYNQTETKYISCRKSKKNIEKSNVESDVLKEFLYPCKICGEVFRSKKTLYRHGIRDNHLTTEQIARRKKRKPIDYVVNENGSYVCKVCLSEYKSRKALQWHMVRHREKNVSCTQCDKHFHFPTELARHIESKHSDPNVSAGFCHLCGQGFSTRHGVTKHIKQVHEFQTIPCDICARKFRNRFLMHEHRRVHTGERPYVCEICMKTFRRLNTMKVHKMTHSDVRPHCCKFCRVAFKTRQRLNAHMQRCHEAVEFGSNQNEDGNEKHVRVVRIANGYVTKREECL